MNKATIAGIVTFNPDINRLKKKHRGNNLSSKSSSYC